MWVSLRFIKNKNYVVIVHKYKHQHIYKRMNIKCGYREYLSGEGKINFAINKFNECAFHIHISLNYMSINVVACITGVGWYLLIFVYIKCI